MKKYLVDALFVTIILVLGLLCILFLFGCGTAVYKTPTVTIWEGHILTDPAIDGLEATVDVNGIKHVRIDGFKSPVNAAVNGTIDAFNLGMKAAAMGVK